MFRDFWTYGWKYIEFQSFYRSKNYFYFYFYYGNNIEHTKVETLVVDHLRDLGADGQEFEVVEIVSM